MTFNVSDAHEVELSELVETEQLVTLARVAEELFREVRGIPPGRTLESAGFFEEGGFHLPHAFGIRADGLVLHYDEYEIASYAQGPTTMTIPWSRLAGILRAEAGDRLRVGRQ